MCYDLSVEDRDYATKFIAKLDKKKNIETAKVFFDPKPGSINSKRPGEVEKLFLSRANYKLDQNFLILESFS